MAANGDPNVGVDPNMNPNAGEEDPGIAVMLALSDMQTHMLYTSMVSTIDVFDGESEGFQDWLQSIEKVRRLLENSDSYTIKAVVQTTGGFLGEFVQRFVDQNPDGTWELLKSELK